MERIMMVAVIACVAFGCAIAARWLVSKRFSGLELPVLIRHRVASRPMKEITGRTLDVARRANALLPVTRLDSEEARDRLAQAGLKMDAQTWHGLTLLVPVCAMTLGLAVVIVDRTMLSALKVVVMGAALLIGYLIPKFILWSLARDRRRKIRVDLASTLELLAVIVRAGFSVERGIKLIGQRTDGPLAEEFRQVDTEMNLLGIPLDRALERMARRCGLPAVDAFTVAISQAVRQGTSVSKILSSQAKMVRNEHYTETMTLINGLPNKMIPVIMLVFIPQIMVICLTPSLVSAARVFMSTFG